jgi:hypothetical protein
VDDAFVPTVAPMGRPVESRVILPTVPLPETLKDVCVVSPGRALKLNDPMAAHVRGVPDTSSIMKSID